ncbi:hypothetical protein CDAR_321301 [Caerostris darwini]|uniref:Uncharacterized protein n=1 Tax=Caerostris darwini TaxID=1538125 RepID=A0AAV4P6D9_9ARAC|nr:hypothetical protein CDAR_321301 [Caerostris darwini]
MASKTGVRERKDPKTVCLIAKVKRKIGEREVRVAFVKAFQTDLLQFGYANVSQPCTIEIVVPNSQFLVVILKDFRSQFGSHFQPVVIHGDRFLANKKWSKATINTSG